VDTSNASIEIRGRRCQMKKRGPKAYSEEYRREAVRLAEAGTKPLAQIARELGDSSRDAARLAAARAARGEPEATGAVVPSLEEENPRLRRENARLLEEREILKKATAFFAKDAR
jgi:transposase